MNEDPDSKVEMYRFIDKDPDFQLIWLNYPSWNIESQILCSLSGAIWYNEKDRYNLIRPSGLPELSTIGMFLHKL